VQGYNFKKKMQILKKNTKINPVKTRIGQSSQQMSKNNASFPVVLFSVVKVLGKVTEMYLEDCEKPWLERCVLVSACFSSDNS